MGQDRDMIEWVIASQPPLLKNDDILIPGTYGYVTLNGKRDFVGVIKLRILKWGDYLGVSTLVQCDHKGPYKREVGGSQTQKAMWP